MNPHRTLIFALAACGLSAIGANAANFRSSPLVFNSSPITFNSGAISYPSSPLAFPSSMIATESAGTLEVTLPADILFDFDKADVRAEAQTALHELAALIRDKARGPVAIHGYTDALGKDAYNQTLSEKRAASIKAWLVKNEGLGKTAFSTSGFGPRDPVAPNKNADGNDNPEGRQLNRRVTLLIHK